MEVRTVELLRVNAEALGLALRQDADISGPFAALVRTTRAAHGEPVVVLVDE